jgi:hypothetical protein
VAEILEHFPNRGIESGTPILIRMSLSLGMNCDTDASVPTPPSQEEHTTLAMDGAVFALDDKRWDSFVEALDVPKRRHPRLERLFRELSLFRQS